MVPVAPPLVLLFDSLVSCLRTYSVAELENMTKDIGKKTYIWEIGEIKSPGSPIAVTYLLGYPSEN